MTSPTEKTETFYGACPHDCPDGCAMLYEVKDKQLTKVSGNPAHPFTRGRLCVKVKDYEKHHYNADRIRYPLKRHGKKGDGAFTRISWDEALNEIYERWQALIAEYGARTILPYGYAGNMGLLNGMNAGDAFFNRLGASIGEKTFCASSTLSAQLMTVGPTLGTDPQSFVHSKFIVLWGANTLSTNSHLWPFVLEARKKGAKVIVIDFYRSRTAAQSDWHIAPRPGTDGALALAIINTIISENLYDQDYVDRYVSGFAELSSLAEQYSAESAEQITGISAEEIKRFAHEYVRDQPSVIKVGVGLERYPGGGQAIRAIDCLPALSGAWRHVGGGLLQMPVFVPVRFDLLSRPDWIGEDSRVINLAQIAAALDVDSQLNPAVHSLFVWNANPLSQAPDSNRVRKGLEREDLFTVISEQFMTDTARYADILLPASMNAEHNDIVTSWGHFHIQLNQKAIEPPGEAISNFEMFQRLAQRFGFKDERFTLTDKELLKVSLDWEAPLLKGKSWDELESEGFIRVNVSEKDEYLPHAKGNFPTPSGKCEFVSALGEKNGFIAPPLRQMLEGRQNSSPIPPLPDYIPACSENESADFPLQLISPKSHAFLNSEYANEEHKIRTQGEQFVLIHPDDAKARKIADGEVAKVFNGRGEFVADVSVTEDVLPGNIVATFGYWASMNPLKGAVNSLTKSEEAGFAGTPHYYSTQAEMIKIN